MRFSCLFERTTERQRESCWFTSLMASISGGQARAKPGSRSFFSHVGCRALKMWAVLRCFSQDVAMELNCYHLSSWNLNLCVGRPALQMVVLPDVSQCHMLLAAAPTHTLAITLHIIFGTLFPCVVYVDIGEVKSGSGVNSSKTSLVFVWSCCFSLPCAFPAVALAWLGDIVHTVVWSCYSWTMQLRIQVISWLVVVHHLVNNQPEYMWHHSFTNTSSMFKQEDTKWRLD